MNHRAIKVFTLVLLCLLLVANCLAACQSKEDGAKTNESGDTKTEQSPTEQNGSKTQGDAQTAQGNPIVEFTFSTGDTARFVLYPDQAPITVTNFLRYVEEDFYEGTIIHRIDYTPVLYNDATLYVPFVVQGGGYESVANSIYNLHKETHDPIKGEFASNGVDNNVKHVRGAISMARTKDPDSATSEFFFCPITMSSFDGEYAAFGQALDDESLQTIINLATTKTLQVNEVQYVPEETITVTSVKLTGYQQ